MRKRIRRRDVECPLGPEPLKRRIGRIGTLSRVRASPPACRHIAPGLLPHKEGEKSARRGSLTLRPREKERKKKA